MAGLDGGEAALIGKPAATAPAITLIVAGAGENRVIGRRGEIPWHFKEDMKFFKSQTEGRPCIMGRKTFDSIVKALGKPLPNRTSIVLTRKYAPTPVYYGESGVVYADSLDAALGHAAKSHGAEKGIRVIGGADVYAAAMPLASEILYTAVSVPEEKLEGADTFFPEIPAAFKLVETRKGETEGLHFLKYVKS